MTAFERLHDALAETSLPTSLTDDLAPEALDLWLMSEPSVELLASDLALCHPAPTREEARARAVAIDRLGRWRITVVATDRPGLLADTTGVVASAGMAVTAASALTLGTEPLAVHSLTVSAPKLDESGWAELGDNLRQAAAGQLARPAFEPTGVTEVSATGQPGGLKLVTVSAPDQLGLLSAVCGALADQSVSIEVALVAGRQRRAEDLFLVRGDVDVVDLASRLSRTGRWRLAEMAAEWAGRTPLVGSLLKKGLEAVI
ncbi:MAG TPA: hypothetical protein VMU63_10770 [Acidimicrobiales bacterium]|nr:hypothetical protein [Acidimicrobiales bacterium]